MTVVRLSAVASFVAAALGVLACSKPPPGNCCDDAAATASVAPTSAAVPSARATPKPASVPAWASALPGTYGFSGKGSEGKIVLRSPEISSDGKWWVFAGVLEMTSLDSNRWMELKAETADGFERACWINGTKILGSLPAAGRKAELQIMLPNESIRVIEFVNGIGMKLEYRDGRWTSGR